MQRLKWFALNALFCVFMFFVGAIGFYYLYDLTGISMPWVGWGW
jgi:hypothetical protein